MTTPCLRIVIADDHEMIRTVVTATLQSHQDCTVVAQARDGEQAVQCVKKHRPDLLILDVSMPGPSTDQVILRCLAAVPGLKVLILSGSENEAFLRQLKTVPIHGYILKEEAPVSLLQAVRTIAGGAPWYSPSVALRLKELAHSSRG